MRASDVLNQIGKSSRQAAAEIGISKTMLLNFLNHGKPPQRRSAAICQQITDYFQHKGVDVSGCLKTTPAQDEPKPEKDNEMLLRKSALSLATRQHFGLTRDPFHDEIRAAQDVFI